MSDIERELTALSGEIRDIADQVERTDLRDEKAVSRLSIRLGAIAENLVRLGQRARGVPEG